jgi:hypothetical protein
MESFLLCVHVDYYDPVWLRPGSEASGCVGSTNERKIINHKGHKVSRRVLPARFSLWDSNPVIKMLFPGFAFTIFPGNWPLGISSVISEFDSGRGGWGWRVWTQPRARL